MKCLETRMRPDGIRTRRYELDDGRRITTFELPATVVKGIGMKRVRAELSTWQRGEEMRKRQEKIKQRLAEGIKPTAIAHEFGVTDQRVRQIRKEMFG